MINKSPNAFVDVEEAFERALAAPRGIKIPCLSRGAAIRLRQRFNYYRKMNREWHRQIYNKGDPQYGISPYDRLELRIPAKGTNDEAVLYLEPRSAENLTIEEIM